MRAHLERPPRPRCAVASTAVGVATSAAMRLSPLAAKRCLPPARVLKSELRDLLSCTLAADLNRRACSVDRRGAAGTAQPDAAPGLGTMRALALPSAGARAGRRELAALELAWHALRPDPGELKARARARATAAAGRGGGSRAPRAFGR